MRVGDDIELRAERLGRGGSGSGKVGRFVIEVEGLLPGERARVRLEHVRLDKAKRHGRGHARPLEILEPAAARRQPACAHQGQCDGCPLMIAGEAFQAEVKRAQLRELGIEVDRVVQLGDGLRYRLSAKRVFGGVPNAIVLGSYRRRSHAIAPMSGCLVDHPDLVGCATEIEAAASALGIEPYDEEHRAGDLRYVWLKTNGEGDVLVTLVSAGAPSRAADLAARLERPSGVAWAVQPSSGNAMRGGSLELLRGKGSVRVRLAGVEVDVGPLGFLQPNPRMAEIAYHDLVSGPHRGTPHPGALLPGLGSAKPAGQLAFDLYAGAGITTALLRADYAEVRACEAYPESAAALGIAPSTAEAFLAAQSDAPALVVANPPRAGLSEEVCRALSRLAPAHLHVMSCDPATLARDLARLTESFEITGARAYDTLPQTAHIEVIVWLKRRAP